MRIDDLDTPRNVTGATESIIETLQAFGLDWHGSIEYQSHKHTHYHSIISELNLQGLAYPCTCTRKILSTSPVYPGTCRNTQQNRSHPHSLRVISKDISISFTDELQGTLSHNMANQDGDFIIKRKDNITAYQLAVVIDDYQQNITHVIRGFDLLDSTPKQIYLQSLLNYPTPHYCHVPIVTDERGTKLSKQSFAQAVTTINPEKTLFLLLTLLKQSPPVNLKSASIKDILNWAIEHWQIAPLKRIDNVIS